MPIEESPEEHERRHLRVSELVSKMGDLLDGEQQRDGLDALCMVIANVCADCDHPDATLVDAIAFVTEFFKTITSDDEDEAAPPEEAN
jgi:hypothetical protein